MKCDVMGSGRIWRVCKAFVAPSGEWVRRYCPLSILVLPSYIRADKCPVPSLTPVGNTVNLASLMTVRRMDNTPPYIKPA